MPSSARAGHAAPPTELPPPTPAHILALPSQVHGCVAGDRRTIYVVRRKDLLHVPATPEYSLEAYRRHFVLTLCPAFAAHGDCTAGLQCRQAHAKLHGSFGRFTPHFVPDDPERVPASERFAADLPAVPVTRAAAQGSSSVAAAATALVRPSDCLITRAPMAASHAVVSATTTSPAAPPLSHCGHWLNTGLCHYGATCRFVHTLMRPAAVESLESSSQLSATGRSPTSSPTAATTTTTAAASSLTPSPAPRQATYQHDPYGASPIIIISPTTRTRTTTTTTTTTTTVAPRPPRPTKYITRD